MGGHGKGPGEGPPHPVLRPQSRAAGGLVQACPPPLPLCAARHPQERDASTASVQALVQLVNDNPAYLPLGGWRAVTHSNASKHGTRRPAKQRAAARASCAGIRTTLPVPRPRLPPAPSLWRWRNAAAPTSPYLPLSPRKGFAYGHLRDRVLPYMCIGGRGYAGQELIEEFQAKQDLAREVGGGSDRPGTLWWVW